MPDEHYNHNTQLVQAATLTFEGARVQIKNLAEQCSLIIVHDKPSLLEAKDMAKEAKKIEDAIEKRRVEFTKPLLDTQRDIKAMADNLKVDLQEAIKELRHRILTYEEEQERQRLAEIARIEQERKEQEEALRAKAMAEQEITPEEIDQLIATKEAQVEIVMAPAETSLRKVWAYEITHPNKIPREYMTIDEKAIGAAVRSGVREIPGVKIFQKNQLNLR